uniref:Uncharacterized protein n=1 Tax=Oncorhynchus tshawytscha TaxID=74940 RepID=A0AAZ3R4N4_ONCTS
SLFYQEFIVDGAYHSVPYLQGAYHSVPYLQGAYHSVTYLQGAYHSVPYLQGAYHSVPYLQGAYHSVPYLQGAYHSVPYLQGAYHSVPYLQGAYHSVPYLQGAYHSVPYLQGAYHSVPYLQGAYHSVPYLQGAYHSVPYLQGAIQLNGIFVVAFVRLMFSLVFNFLKANGVTWVYFVVCLCMGVFRRFWDCGLVGCSSKVYGCLRRFSIRDRLYRFSLSVCCFCIVRFSSLLNMYVNYHAAFWSDSPSKEENRNSKGPCE